MRAIVYLRCCLDSLAGGIRADAVLYLITVAYTICGVAFVQMEGDLQISGYEQYVWPWTFNFLVLFPIVFFLGNIFRVIHRLNQRRWSAFRHLFIAPAIGRYVAGLLLLMSLMVFQGTFTAVKIALSAQQGFVYDRLLAAADRWIHFGYDPWTLLYDVAGFDWVRRAIEINYDVVWFIACFAALFWVATAVRAERLRLRYILTFMAVWILIGNILAGLFISAGPAFYGLTTGDTARYAGLMRFLSDGKGDLASAAMVQHYLWEAYRSGRSGIGTGISAFPSIHVALITMNALFLFEWRRRWGIAAFVYVAFIVCSSIMLGWHYAIGGYAAILLTAGIFYGIKRLLAVRPRQDAGQAAGVPERPFVRAS